MNTSELSGPALDWAVAQATGRQVIVEFERDVVDVLNGDRQWVLEPVHTTYVLCVRGRRELTDWKPSSDWAQCGPLISRYRVWLSDDGPQDEDGPWLASIQGVAPIAAPTATEAVCRAVVLHVLGPTVELPEGLR